MSSDCSDTESIVAPARVKPRLSLFNTLNNALKPDDGDVTTDCLTDDYFNKLKAEKEQWLKLYEDVRSVNISLKKGLVNKKIPIDSSLFSEEDKKFINNRPDYLGFVDQALELEKDLKVVLSQNKTLQVKNELKLLHLKMKMDALRQVCCNNLD